jgi:cytidylate kinase
MALILAEQLKLKYIYAGGVLKEWAKRMGYDFMSDSFHEWEDKYGKDWDEIWEKYIEKKLSTQQNFLYEGKTAGFLLPENVAFEVMVVADADTRAERAAGDGRTEEIIARDKFLQKRWQELFSFDLLDRQEIKKNYDFLLDNSKLSIHESIVETLAQIEKYAKDMELQIPAINEEKIKAIEAEYWRKNEEGKAKNFLKSRLNNEHLYFSNSEIFIDFKKLVPEIVANLPAKMSSVI